MWFGVCGLCACEGEMRRLGQNRVNAPYMT